MRPQINVVGLRRTQQQNRLRASMFMAGIVQFGPDVVSSTAI